jgi:GST-like protein
MSGGLDAIAAGERLARACGSGGDPPSPARAISTGAACMSDVYTPPEVWTFDPENGGQFAGINRPSAGAREEKELPVGEHPFQLYSLGTPNGVKVTIMFEGNQFWSGFVEINPNSKIPALVDRSGPEPFRVFESGAILIHLAEKFGYLLPTSGPARAEALSWLMWQMGSAPSIGGGFGHFYVYAPERFKYPIDRYSMETKRLFAVADMQLAKTEYLAGSDYTIADVAAYTWLGNLYHGAYNGSDRFLSLHEYENVGRWVKAIDARPAAIRGRLVNSQAGLAERHSAADFDTLDQVLFDPVRRRADF